MSNSQSYNHFMPRSIIKAGWGFQLPGVLHKSVNILDYNRLRDFLQKNPDINESMLINALKNEFGKTEDVKDNLVIRRNPDSIMGNKLVQNLTEKKFSELNLHVEKDIESLFYKYIQNETIKKNNLTLLYHWFALQQSRSVANIMNIYSTFRRN